MNAPDFTLDVSASIAASAGSALAFRVGQRVRFTGFRAPSWEYPDIKIGEECVIVSVKEAGQCGFDYWALLDRGARFAFQASELEAMPNDPSSATAATKRPD